jgi:ribonuclease G
MSKELFISTSPHETKVAVLEDDQLVEVYFERVEDVGLVGGIYKGRVSRVLPGMQSAFVDIGLERDAFLYVSDFYEDEEEYDKVFSEAEARATKYAEGPKVMLAEAPAGEKPGAEAGPEPVAEEGAQTAAPAATEEPPPASPPVAPPPKEPSEPRGYESRGRRRRRRGRGGNAQRLPSKPEPSPRSTERQDYPAPHAFEVLPGESLAKYSGAGSEASPQESPEAVPAGAAEMEAPGTEPVAGELEAQRTEEPTTPAATEPATTLEPAPATPTADEEEIFRPSIFYEAGTQSEEPAKEPITASESEAAAAPDEPEETPPAQPDEEESPETLIGFRLPGQPEKPGEAPAKEEPEQTPPSEDAAPESSEIQAADEAASAPPPEVTGGEIADPPANSSPANDEGATESPTAEPPAESVPQESGGTSAVTAEPPAEPREQKYTLREPYQRPRFVPRRRRGRRGGGRRTRPERHESGRSTNHHPVQIADVLKEGQEIIVQIAKEPLGTKGARITSHIALPGRYLVYMPTISHIGVSRKIASEEERLRLRNIILENRGSLTGGFIVRTAGGGRSEEEFKADLRFLSTLWSEIRGKAERTKAPALLHRDLELVQRILRDILSPDFKKVRVDNESDYERVVEFVNRCQPSLVGNVRLHTRSTPMFEEFGIQAEIDKALKPKVWLKSGGYIVINQTEALVAIDVNTGKYVGKTNRLEDTIVKTNVDAVNEIVRQLRLRDLGGIIVIDFIDMDERRNRNKVVQALEEALRRDRAPTKILSINEFGLVALTRKRVKQSLERTLCEPCSYCEGSGWVKSVNTVCNEILSEVKKMAGEIEGDVMTLRVNPEVAQSLKSRQGALISQIESLTHKDLIIKGDPAVHQERFEIF